MMQPTVSTLFVCSAPEDAAFVQPYIAVLEARGVRVTTDAQVRAAGGNLAQTIPAALVAARAFVVILSPAALASDWVNYTLDIALDLVGRGAVRLFLPVTAASCQTPLLMRRYKRVEGHNGQPVSVPEAVGRTLQSLTTPATVMPEIAGAGPRRRSRTGLVIQRTAIALSILLPLSFVLLFTTGIYQTLLLSPTPTPTIGAYGGPYGSVDFNDVQMLAPNNGWLVGSNGTILHYDGHHWQPQASSTTVKLTALAMLPGGSTGWAIGTNGTILHDQQGAWTQQPSQTTESLNGIAALSATDAWIVGDQGTILHYQNGAWQAVASPVPSALASISMSSPHDGWIVGDFQNDAVGTATLLHYNGTAWKFVTVKGFEHVGFPAVSMLAPNNGWFDASFSDGTVMYHYDGATWHASATLRHVTLGGMRVTSAVNGWAWGFDENTFAVVLFHFDGTTWTQTPIPALPSSSSAPTLSNLGGVSGDLSDAWAAGTTGQVLHYQGGAWSQRTP